MNADFLYCDEVLTEDDLRPKYPKGQIIVTRTYFVEEAQIPVVLTTPHTPPSSSVSFNLHPVEYTKPAQICITPPEPAPFNVDDFFA